MSDQLSFDSAEISTARAFYDFFLCRRGAKGSPYLNLYFVPRLDSHSE